MFYSNSSLTNLQFTADLTNATTISYMFTESPKLENAPTFINLENATKLQTIQYTFQKCRALKEIDFSELRGPALTSIQYAFDECEALTTLRLDNFEGPKITNYSYAFRKCKSLTSIDLSKAISQPTNMASTFNNCSEVTEIRIPLLDTSKVTNMSYLFANCPKLTTIEMGDGFSTESATDLSYMFYNSPQVQIP